MRFPIVLFAVQIALLATHQVDAAFWHEWDVFGVPGGIPFFLAFHFGAMLVLLASFAAVASGHRQQRAFTLGAAATGGLTAALHAIFLARDRIAFWTLPSLAVLGAIVVVAVAQVATTQVDRPHPRGAPLP